MNGMFYTNESITTVPYVTQSPDTQLNILIFDSDNNLSSLKVDGKTPIPHTSYVISDKIPLNNTLPSWGMIHKINKTEIANINVPDVIGEIKEHLVKYIHFARKEHLTIVATYIFSTWFPECYFRIPQLLVSCPNAIGNGVLCQDVMRGLVPTIDINTNQKDMMNAAAHSMTIIGDIQQDESWQRKIHYTGNKRGKRIRIGHRIDDTFGPRILTRSAYQRFTYCYEVMVLDVNGDKFYSDLNAAKEADLLKQRLLLCRLRYARELRSKASLPKGQLDILGNFKNIENWHYEKLKFILLPTLLYNNAGLADLVQYTAKSYRVDTNIDRLIINAIGDILQGHKSEKGWWVQRENVLEIIQDDLEKIGYDFEWHGDYIKMVGVVMFALGMKPAHKQSGHWYHWCRHDMIKQWKEKLKEWE